MSDDTFDPFNLPSSFDPLGSDSREPTGRSAYTRHTPEPTGRSAYMRQEPTSPHQRRRAAEPAARASESATVEERTASAGAGGRLTHLLRAAALSELAGGSAAGNSATPGDSAVRLATLEDKIAILNNRLDDFQALLDQKLDSQQERLVRAVSTLLDEQKRPPR